MHLAIDATHFESCDAAKPTEKKEPAPPKKRRRKSKVERDAWLTEQEEIKDPLDTPLETLWQEVPVEPNWCIKSKNTFWFGFKGHLAVTTKSQYIVGHLMTSASLSDLNRSNLSS